MGERARHLAGRHLRQEGAVRRALRVLPSMVAVGLILTALVVVGLPTVTDGEWRTVTTGSMEPTIDPGDVILTFPQPRPPRVGDVVTFRDPITRNRDIVHRVVATDADGRLTTKGDANNGNDPWTLAPSEVTGAVSLRVPAVGWLVSAATSKPGTLIFLVFPALGLFLNETRVWYRYVRYGAEAFETKERARHRPGRGRHLEGALA